MPAGLIHGKIAEIKREAAMAQKKASLACSECGSRNYSISVGATPKPTRLEVNKYCKYCKKYTLHKETR